MRFYTDQGFDLESHLFPKTIELETLATFFFPCSRGSAFVFWVQSFALEIAPIHARGCLNTSRQIFRY